MRKAWMLTFAGLLIVAAVAPAFADDGAADILGVWLTEDKDAHIEVTEGQDGYSGKIVWLEEPIYPPDDEQGMAGLTKVDRENPDPELRQRAVLGLEMMGGFEYAGKGQWKGGWIYDPNNGKTYKCKITLREDGVLFVRGFIGFSLLGRTNEWTRVSLP